MIPYLKTGLAQQVAAELVKRVISGHAGENLPGVRVLSKTLGVSVPTICQALHLLQADGFLEGGSRRRWKVADGAPSELTGDTAPSNHRGKGIRTRRLLFVSSLPLSSQRFSAVETFSALLDQLGTSDWEVLYRVIQYAEAKTPRRAWDELLRFLKPDAMVALVGTPVLGKWAVKQNIRTLFLGGDSGGSGVAMIRIEISAMLRDATSRLAALGHKNVLLPLCGRIPAFVERCRNIANELNAGGETANTLILAESNYTGREVITNLLHRKWKNGPPDGMIFLDWREFVAADGFFREMGLEIPRDLSVILLSHNTIMEWHSPPMSHYQHPSKIFAKEMAKWVANEKTPRNTGQFIEVKAQWEEQRSVRDRNPPLLEGEL